MSYFVDTQLENDIDKVAVFENTVELYDKLMMQSFVNFDLRQKLNILLSTFCFALFFCRDVLSITLMAYDFFVSKLRP